MYVRTKTFKNKDDSTRTYLYIVEGRHVTGKARQEIVANLGRLEELQEKGLDQIIEGLVKFKPRPWRKKFCLGEFLYEFGLVFTRKPWHVWRD